MVICLVLGFRPRGCNFSRQHRSEEKQFWFPSEETFRHFGDSKNLLVHPSAWQHHFALVPVASKKILYSRGTGGREYCRASSRAPIRRRGGQSAHLTILASTQPHPSASDADLEASGAPVTKLSEIVRLQARGQLDAAWFDSILSIWMPFVDWIYINSFALQTILFIHYAFLQTDVYWALHSPAKVTFLVISAFKFSTPHVSKNITWLPCNSYFDDFRE